MRLNQFFMKLEEKIQAKEEEKTTLQAKSKVLRVGKMEIFLINLVYGLCPVHLRSQFILD